MSIFSALGKVAGGLVKGVKAVAHVGVGVASAQLGLNGGYQTSYGADPYAYSSAPPRVNTAVVSSQWGPGVFVSNPSGNTEPAATKLAQQTAGDISTPTGSKTALYVVIAAVVAALLFLKH